MGANTAAALPAAGPDNERAREQWLIAEARSGSAWALAALEAAYQPMVNGYLTCLTGNPDAARALTREALARMERQLYGAHGVPSLPAWLLIDATDTGLAYLRHVRALQLAGAGGPPRMAPAPSRGGPATWLRTAFERFRPSTDADQRARRQPADPSRPAASRRAATAPRDAGSSATRRLHMRGGRNALRGGPRAPDPRDTLRRRILRAALADLAPEAAHCLALHLVAGLSHAEVAYVSGLDPHVARAAIMEGLELFAVRYDEAVELLGISPSLFDEPPVAQPGLPPRDAASQRTLALRGAATPTYQLEGRPRVRALAQTTPRHGANALPMPRAPRAIPVRTPGQDVAAGRANSRDDGCDDGSASMRARSRRAGTASQGYQGDAATRRPDAAPTHQLRQLPQRPSPTPTSARVPVLSADGAVPRIPVRSPVGPPPPRVTAE